MAAHAFAGLIEQVDHLEPIIRDHAAESEQLGQLAPPVVEALHGAGVFRMLVPAEFGGSDVTLPQSVEVIQRLAALDAATGWTVAILAGGALFTRRVAADARATLWADPAELLVSTLNPMPARAERVGDGYRFSGKAGYLSGSAHATWVLTSAIVTVDGQPVFTDTGPEVRAGVFRLDRADRRPTWNVTGTRATGSDDYEFADVDVAEDWTFPLWSTPRPGQILDDLFAAIPLWSQVGGVLAAVAVGAARNMIDRFVELASAKVPAGGLSPLAERPVAQLAIAEAQGLYQAARALLMETTDDVWTRGTTGGSFDLHTLAEHRAGSVTSVRLAARSIDLLHDAAGMSAVAADGVLDRCWRDVHTITQHVLLSIGRFEVVGRVLMGLDPASPVI